MRTKNKSLLVLAILTAFIATALFLPVGCQFGKPSKQVSKYEGFEGNLSKQISKQNQAKSNLISILTSQITYFGEEGTYASSIANLRWAPEGNTYYSYTIVEADSTHFRARAVGNIDDDATLDVWEINEQRDLILLTDDITS